MPVFVILSFELLDAVPVVESCAVVTFDSVSPINRALVKYVSFSRLEIDPCGVSEYLSVRLAVLLFCELEFEPLRFSVESLLVLLLVLVLVLLLVLSLVLVLVVLLILLLVLVLVLLLVLLLVLVFVLVFVALPTDSLLTDSTLLLFSSTFFETVLIFDLLLLSLVSVLSLVNSLCVSLSFDLDIWFSLATCSP